MTPFPSDYPYAQVHPPQRMGGDDVLLHTHWCSAPGRSGEAGLLVRRTAHGTEVLRWDDEAGLEPAIDLPADASWRELVEAVARDDGLGLATSLRVFDLTLEGLTGVPAFMLELAWTGLEEKVVALAMLELTDAQLGIISQSVGPCVGLFLAEIQDVLWRMGDLENAPKTLAQLLDTLYPEGFTSLDGITEELDELLEKQWAEFEGS